MRKTEEVQSQERNLVPMSGSSSSSIAVPPPPTKHNVFLSFRGEDTRNSFTGHLYAELCRKKIQTFIDDRLGKGEEISPTLEKAIEESMIYVIIFSKDYASSSWCLDELTKILECKERYGRDVIPVFYHVDPSNIRHQRGSYADAFVKHEQRQRFKDKVQGWKAALTQAAGLSGWDLERIRVEYVLVEKIVQDILRKLSRYNSFDYQGLVGIYKHIEQIQSKLHVESPAIRIIGLWGIGGIGKTTIATAIYHKLAAQFSSNSIVVNVQKEIQRHGIHHIRSKYLSELLEEGSPYLGWERLKQMKVLLVLDNVNNSGQIKDLIGGHGSFGPGSRIIVTSRDKQVLKNAEADATYKVEEMNFQDSLQLFSLNAFKQNYPTKNYMDLSERVLNYAKGIPLALKVLGSLLYGRTREEWESELRKLETLPDPEIYNMLKLSYDGLDEKQKDIFLDIACFYRGQDMNTVKQTLDDCGLYAAIGMRVLNDRGLISILKGEIMMHDLVQEMGQEIVRQQCVNDPGKRSRLWKPEDVYHVLRRNKGMDTVQCMFLDMCQIKEVKLHPETFRMMHNLRVLQFYKSNLWEHSRVNIPKFLESLPDELRFLRWDGFPQRYLPQDFSPENLVKLDMRHSHLEQLWDGDQHLPNLKRLDLSYSENLIQIPDLSQSPNIEEIILCHCERLVQVYSSSFLSRLNCLWLNGCIGLRSLNLPSNILSSSSGLIVLYNCCDLEMFSVSETTIGVQLYSCSRVNSLAYMFRDTWNLECRPGFYYAYPTTLEKFSDIFDPLDSANVDEVPKNNIHLLNLQVMREGSPSFFPSLNELCWLDLSYCESLTSLPVDLCKLKFLRRLYLKGCSNLEKFPEINETMENLMVLILDQTAIQELPLSLHQLSGLEELSLHRCERLQSIPSSIGSLSKLSKLDLTYCESLEILPSSIFKLRLTKLDLHGCSMLKTFPEILEPAESFAHIRFTETAITEIPSSLERLVGLQTLHLNLCKDLELLPTNIGNVNLLSELDFSGCEKLSEIPSDIGHLSSLRQLSLHTCSIVNLPESIAHLSSLKSLDLSDCKRLECIPQLPPFLKQLVAFDCPSIRRVSSSRFQLPSDSKEAIFKFYLTNSQLLDPSAHGHIVADAWLRIFEGAYKSVLFCFPGSAVPDQFPYRCKGHSVTLSKESLNWCNDDKFIGFALCVVLGLEGEDNVEIKYSDFCYRFTFESDDDTHIVPCNGQLRYSFSWKGRHRFIVHDHTFMWKNYLDSSSISHMLSHADNFTFEICNYDVDQSWSSYRPTFKIKECGISPLYAKENGDHAVDGDSSNFQRFSNNDIEEGNGSKAAQSIVREQKKRRKQDLC